ncbi:MAG: hypothetical protein H6765_10945 [Candidatus Peribacteria bacterium]|nr:MAG: hypothetical protein H6765_10945 [Candidatus Peribacteria bacterium]
MLNLKVLYSRGLSKTCEDVSLFIENYNEERVEIERKQGETNPPHIWNYNYIYRTDSEDRVLLDLSTGLTEEGKSYLNHSPEYYSLIDLQESNGKLQVNIN